MYNWLRKVFKKTEPAISEERQVDDSDLKMQPTFFYKDSRYKVDLAEHYDFNDHAPMMDFTLEEMFEWCDANCLGKWDHLYALKFAFEIETDAVAFKLAWS